MGDPLSDGVFLHTGKPEPRKGLFALRLLVDQPENQFSLAPCVRSADHTVHIRAVHELLQDAKLFFGGRRNQILPPFRQNGQICDTPLDVFGIVDVGRCQFHQMTHTPAYEIAVALQITVFAVGRAEDFSVSCPD